MADYDSRDQTDAQSSSTEPSRISRSIGTVQSYFQKRRSQKQQESAADRAARSTARATWAIAFLTVVAIGVGVSQYIIFSRQLDEMRATREGGDKSFADQLAVMQAQAKAMQGQLDQTALAQRAWLIIDTPKIEQIQNFPVGAGIVVSTSYHITNLGQSPATEIFIATKLIFKTTDHFDDSAVMTLCRARTDSDEFTREGYSPTMLPHQSQTIEGFTTQPASFAHKVEGLEKGSGPEWLALAGCITYNTAQDARLHHSGFAFDVGLDIGDIDYQGEVLHGIIWGIPMDFGQKGPVPITEPLKITPSSVGNFAD